MNRRYRTIGDGVSESVLSQMFHDGMKLEHMRGALHIMGYRSKSGLMLTESHVSNYLRKDMGLRKVSEYKKPNYRTNWRAFVS